MKKPTPPRADRRQHATTHHGVTRDDPYNWLRAENWQEVMQAPETLPQDIRTYLEAENDWFEGQFGEPFADLQETIYLEIRGRIEEDESGVPTPHGPFAYFHRMIEGEQYPVFVRTPRDGGDETVLLDCNKEADGSYFGFGGAEHDPAHRLMIWAADRNGSEYYTIRVRDLTTGRDLDDVIEHTAGSGAWAADSKSFYYVEQDDNHRPYRVRRHMLGAPASDDEIVYEESDPGFFVGLDKTLSGKFIVIASHDHQTSECWLIDAHNPGAPKLVAARETDVEYDLEERHGALYIRTNAGGAEDFKIVTCPVDSPASGNWTDLVPHRPGVLVLDHIVLENHLIRLERFDGLPRIIVRDLKDGHEEEVAFAEDAYALGMSAGYEFATTTLRFTYASPTTPARVYDLDLTTGGRLLRKEQRVPSGHNPDDYEVRRIHAPAPDGETVPVTLLFKRGVMPNGTAPGLLYGYGSYGLTTPSGFSVAALSLADRGLVCATAHIRGGVDKGYRWYRDGRREKKPNSFSDFIAAAERLIADKWVAPDRLVAMGGSAGGLLMGAIANQRPDLWAGIIAQVPFVDVLNTMLDDTLPLTPPEWPEWGNPITSKGDYDLIASYSPYDNVTAQNYPPMFVLAGLTDPRVTYWEPAKWVARLRDTKTDGNPLYLKTHMGAGHGGASGRFDRLKETSLTQAFALWAVGLGQR